MIQINFLGTLGDLTALFTHDCRAQRVPAVSCSPKHILFCPIILRRKSKTLPIVFDGQTLTLCVPNIHTMGFVLNCSKHEKAFFVESLVYTLSGELALT